ncbi:hypothetical protein IM792_02895 [Mucilaginibacter sp. JRF]|nr:hypothetical protein [Mucilaginibacter sp. JRF]
MMYQFSTSQQARSFLFNASQMSDVEPLEEFLSKLDTGEKMSPVEKAAKLIADSGATIIEGGQEAYYDKLKDAIFIPEKSAFENEQKYYQAAIHQLAHWSGHESRLNRPMNGKYGSMDYAREEMRAAIAAIMIGGQLKLGHDFGQHKTYMGAFSKILKEEPFEIAKAARDAQRIVGLLTGESRDRGQKQSSPKAVVFEKGDEIAYMDTVYKVLEAYKNKSIRVEDADGSRRIVKPSDNLYSSLLEAKTNPREREMAETEDIEQEETFKISR